MGMLSRGSKLVEKKICRERGGGDVGGEREGECGGVDGGWREIMS
jgi:hypothetical protein